MIAKIDDAEHIDGIPQAGRTLPIVSVEHFGALNLLAHNYGVLAGLIANYSSVELDDLVKNGYRTK